MDRRTGGRIMNVEIILIVTGVAVTLILTGIAYLKSKEFKVLDKELATDRDLIAIEKKNFYKNLVLEAIEEIVVATNQTFVDELRKGNDGKLTEQQKDEAFKKTYESVKKVVTEEGMEVLNEFIDDVPFWIGELIEAGVNREKTKRAEIETLE